MDYEIVADIGSLKGLSQKGKQSVLDTFTHEYTEWFRENGYADVNITIKYTDGIDYEYNRRKDKGLY